MINSLPPELLAQIFQYSVEMPYTQAENLMVTCKYWYQIALDNGSLWNYINHYSDAVRWYRTRMAYVRVHLRHSRSHSLRVSLCLDSGEPGSIAICQVLASTIHRWTEADMNIIGENPLQTGYKVLHAPAPALCILRVFIFSSDQQKLDLTHLFTDTQSLIHLRIERGATYISAVVLPAMYGLTVKYLELAKFHGASALSIISQLPHIVHLRLMEYITMLEPPLKPISSPLLTTLTFLPILPGELHCFIDKVSMPNLKEVHLKRFFAPSQLDEARLSQLRAEGCTVLYIDKW
jgi:F-box-like